MKSKKNQKRLTAKTIVHVVSGSIAAYKAGDVVTKLREEGARVLCILTPPARHFVTPLVLRALSGERVYDDFFSADAQHSVIHTELAQSADLVLVSPASADFIAHLAAGFAGDLASCTVLAATAPVVVVPAMNDQMLNHPATSRNLKVLKGFGYHLVPPVVGHLVCGKEAVGHIASDDAIVAAVSNLLGS